MTPSLAARRRSLVRVCKGMPGKFPTISLRYLEQKPRASRHACRQTIPLWLCYVDDTFTAVNKDEINDFHYHLNEQNADIQFTKEIEDCLVSRDNNELRTTFL